MSLEVWKTAGAILTALGGAGAIVIAFSSYLGKLWAEKLMAKDKAKYETELATLRNHLESEAAKNLTRLQHELDVYKETHMKGLSDKLSTYRLAIDSIAEVVVSITLESRTGAVGGEAFASYQRQRLKAFGYISMLASQEVLDSFATLTDYLEDVARGKFRYDQIELRKRTFQWVNAIRKDVGINSTEVQLGQDYSLPSHK